MAHAALIIHSARKVDAAGTVEDHWLLARDGAITATGTGTGWQAQAEGAELHDARGLTAVPGFIDLHVHGGGGYGFDGGAEAIRAGLALHRSRGTTRSLVSLVSAPLEQLESSLDAVSALAATDPLVLGAHLEGPFLAPSRRGAHDPAALVHPSSGAVGRLLDAARGRLAQITLAPELPGALAAVERLAGAGTVVAVGHTEADADQARAAFDRGARLVTHAFNAMPGIGHRSPGPIPVALGDERVALELILDGRHVDVEVVRLAFAAAPGRIALVTDAMAAAGPGDGTHRLGLLDVEVLGGVARLAGTAVLAGSTLTQDEALRRAVGPGQLGLQASVAALTAVPARVLGRGDLGLLAPGYRADVVLLDASLRVQRVWADGLPFPDSADGASRPRVRASASRSRSPRSGRP
ncbi:MULTISPECIES: N-acetylglucosamine-6-phosphate deacetylase [unclassified Rathayibacter]|uniref:N-acetylglucosamine-6-phosphate deacetylase n=1 Tax=unclassified Rathayibacter TaxID=2609250 RepID=UPI000CE8374D|nr:MULTISPECIES: amidohydrolase family protein [unclassified Rathayibacter]PPF19506.1 N-acetylglucosamine-6-phosphate deacetylase [Rathayibacter sp. AY1A4]PPG83961.1 N-acetylglucosamine-6-phosphate deacetylase [Rathayibacter sp. AY1E5]PPH32686.1 N-acetylglucosamine-6-phosphate deacetylase [Rathayibacter sp. AY1C3]PPH59723.1 N-acetylglucosamine-6-phosphate deacetylase [Rathayibacter sp. AY1D7]PPI33701.1 N-acetylglucosamine-6-phosphate deacetylase [Rathayibacter sp. AY1B4]